MIDLAGYSYDDHKACIICRHVADGYPVLGFGHDEDGDLHFTCGGDGHEESDWQVVGLSHLLEQVRSMTEMPIVHAGFCAERKSPSSTWLVEPFGE